MELLFIIGIVSIFAAFWAVLCWIDRTIQSRSDRYDDLL